MLLFLLSAFASDPFAPVPTDEPRAIWAGGTEGIGAGFTLGLPTGLSAAWRPGGPFWGQAVVAWSFDNDTLALAVDALYTLASPTARSNADFIFPVYVGVGPRLRFGDGADNGSLNDAILGLRIPVGMCFQHQGFPIEGFLEIAPGIGLIPDTVPLFDFGVGARFYIPGSAHRRTAPPTAL